MLKKNAYTILTIVVALVLILLVVLITNKRIGKLEGGTGVHGKLNR